MRGHQKAIVAGAAALVLQAGPAAAETVSCGASSKHPVCIATYAANPVGSIGRGQQSVGTAVVKGKSVRFVCASGTATRARQCSY